MRFARIGAVPRPEWRRVACHPFEADPILRAVGRRVLLIARSSTRRQAAWTAHGRRKRKRRPWRVQLGRCRGAFAAVGLVREGGSGCRLSGPPAPRSWADCEGVKVGLRGAGISRRGPLERSESDAYRDSRLGTALRSNLVPARCRRGCPPGSGSVRCVPSSRVPAVPQGSAGHGQR